MSRYQRKDAGPVVVDAIQVTFDTTREALRAFDKRVMVGPNWDEFDRWIMLPSGEREFCYDDWIVRSDHDGGLWFCDGEMFATYYTPYESHRLVDSDAYYVAPFDSRKVYLGGMV